MAQLLSDIVVRRDAVQLQRPTQHVRKQKTTRSLLTITHQSFTHIPHCLLKAAEGYVRYGQEGSKKIDVFSHFFSRKRRPTAAAAVGGKRRVAEATAEAV